MQENIHFLSGLERCKKGQFAEAIPFFTQSLIFEPSHVASLYNRGLAQLKLGKLQEAIEDFDKALLYSPQNATIMSDRGVAKHLLGNSEAALSDMDEALRLEPANAYRYSSRAFVRASAGKVKEAIDDYKKAIELDPEDAVSYNNLGMLEEQLGYANLAKQRFGKADQISTSKGEQQFERPDIDKLLDEYKLEKEEKSRKQEAALYALQQALTTDESGQKPKPSVRDYWGVFKSVFTDRQVFNELIGFISNGFKNPDKR